MSTSHLNNLAPGRTSKFNLAADCIALATTMVTVAMQGSWRWYQAALLRPYMSPRLTECRLRGT